jgi:hypothetical protein
MQIRYGTVELPFQQQAAMLQDSLFGCRTSSNNSRKASVVPSLPGQRERVVGQKSSDSRGSET